MYIGATDARGADSDQDIAFWDHGSTLFRRERQWPVSDAKLVDCIEHQGRIGDGDGVCHYAVLDVLA